MGYQQKKEIREKREKRRKCERRILPHKKKKNVFIESCADWEGGYKIVSKTGR